MRSPRKKFRRLARLEQLLVQGPNMRPVEVTLISLGVVLALCLLAVLIPFLRFNGASIMTGVSPGTAAKDAVDVQVKLMTVLTWAIGFTATTWQLARSVTLRKEDDRWKAIDVMSQKYDAFCRDDSVNSVKRILESIKGGYAPIIFVASRLPGSSENWIELTREEVRNGLTGDSKQDEDGGFHVQDGQGEWSLNDQEHTARENEVAYNVDGFCNHLINFDRVLVNKNSLIDDFYARLHYWVRLVSGMSTLKSAEQRLGHHHGKHLSLPWWLASCTLDLYGLAPSAAKEHSAWWQSEPEHKERMRCHSLAMLYLAEYYCDLGSDDVVLLLSKVVFRNRELATMDDDAVDYSATADWAEFAEDKKSLEAVFASQKCAPIAHLGESVVKKCGCVMAELAKAVPPDPHLDHGRYNDRRVQILRSFLRMAVVVSTAGCLAARSRKSISDSIYRRVAILAFWRSVFELSVVGAQDFGLALLDRRLSEGLDILVEASLGARAVQTRCWDPVVAFGQ